MREVPLPVLLSRALLQFAREYRRAGDGIAHPSSPSLVFWSNLLRYLDSEGMLLTHAPRAARLSRRMVKPLLDGFRRAGGLAVEPGAGRGKKVVRLTPAGAAMKEAWAPLLDEVDQSWRLRLGAGNVERAKEALEHLVVQFDLEHPHFPLGYGAVDDSVTGGAAVPARAGPPFIPPHGKDWVPVVRDDPAAVTALPVPALLSQALVEFALHLELAGEVPLPTGWMVRWLPDQGAPAREVAAAWGDNFKLNAAISRSGIMQLEDGIVTLTDKGRALRSSQGAAVAQAEARWCDLFGRRTVDELRASLEAIGARFDPDLPEHPMVSWVGGLRVVGVDG